MWVQATCSQTTNWFNSVVRQRHWSSAWDDSVCRISCTDLPHCSPRDVITPLLLLQLASFVLRRIHRVRMYVVFCHNTVSFYRARCTLVQSAVLLSRRRLSVSLSVRLSVTLVNCDHIGWNISKIISPLVSLGCSLFASPTWRVCSRGIPLNLGPKWPTPSPVDLSVGDIRSQIAAEWLQIAQRSQWRAYRKLPSLFLMMPSLTPYDLPSPPQMGVPCAHNICEWPYLCNGWSDSLHVWF